MIAFSPTYPQRIISAEMAFYSDGHTGHKRARVGDLLRNLRSIDAPIKIFVGDMLDLDEIPHDRTQWQSLDFLRHFERHVEDFMPPTHAAVWREVQRQAANGVEFFYEPGNHDPELRRYAAEKFFGATITRHHEIDLPDGRRALMIHGDELDSAWCKPTTVQKLGDRAYYYIIYWNEKLNRLQARCGRKPLEISATIKSSFKQIMAHMGHFDEKLQTLLQTPEHSDCDVVIAGHIHRQLIQDFDIPAADGIPGRHGTYVNCGDGLEAANVTTAHAWGLCAWNRPRWQVLGRQIAPADLKVTFRQIADPDAYPTPLPDAPPLPFVAGQRRLAVQRVA